MLWKIVQNSFFLLANPKRPKFLKCFKDVQAAPNESVRLEAKIEAYPPPEVKWLKDGVPVRQSSNIHLETHPDGRVALNIDAMKPENVGQYQLIVTNRLGETSSEAKVDIEKRPQKPMFAKPLMPQTVVEGYPAKFEVKAEGFPQPKIIW